MPYKSGATKATARFNKHDLQLRWPRPWIVIIGLVQILLTFAIAGVEVGNTIFDLYRSTAFGGFIAFIPLIICAIFVLITACKPKLVFVRIAVILCFLMIILCIALITYDVFVIIDPTQCFFLNCNYAAINTGTGTFYGWPVSVTWPTTFTISMNVKRLFQSIQLLCSALYILFSCLFILTYFIYRHIKLTQQTMYAANRGPYTTNDPNQASARNYVVAPSPRPANRAPSPRPTTTRAVSRNSNTISNSYSHFPPQKVTMYSIEGHPDLSAHRYTPLASSPMPRTTATPTKSKGKTFVRPRASSVDDNRVCTRCNREPRMILATHYERQNYFSHLCVNCNNEFANNHRKTPHPLTRSTRRWIP